MHAGLVTYIDIRIADPSLCMTRCKSHSRAYLWGLLYGISSTGDAVFDRTECMGI